MHSAGGAACRLEGLTQRLRVRLRLLLFGVCVSPFSALIARVPLVPTNGETRCRVCSLSPCVPWPCTCPSCHWAPTVLVFVPGEFASPGVRVWRQVRPQCPQSLNGRVPGVLSFLLPWGGLGALLTCVVSFLGVLCQDTLS